MMFDALTDLHKQLLSEEMQEALRFVYDTEKSYLAKPKYANHLRMIELVLNTYDLIGFRVRKKVLPKEATLETEWKILLSVWPQLEPFVNNTRRSRGDIPYKEHFIWLVGEARKRHTDYKPMIHRWKLEDKYENPKPCVAVLIVRDARMLLLARRAVDPGKGKWDIPGGFIDRGESAEQAVAREIEEETSLKVTSVKYLGSVPDEYGDSNAPTLNLAFIVEVSEGKPTPQDDVASLEWVPLDKLPPESEMAFAHQKHVLLWCQEWAAGQERQEGERPGA
jgi:ADP-ribose pyrophosphatase YjhB (NUDIX family)